MNGLLNLREERRISRDWDGYLLTFGRNGAPEALLELFLSKAIGVAELRSLICDVWIAAEWPCQYLSRDVWLTWFRAVGFVSDSGKATPPTEPIEVWRAQSGRAIGLSWTTSEEQARWFHDRNARLQHPGRLLRGFVPPESVLAMIDSDDGRKEHEVVIDPTRSRFWKVVK